MKINEIIKIKNKDVLVLGKENSYYLLKFLDTGFETKALKGNILKGEVKDWLAPEIYGVACRGKGAFTSKHPAYKKWMNMLARCYSSSGQGLSGATVCEDWLNYQNFAKWYEENSIPLFELDKDLSGTSIYNPETCVFLPKKINQYINTSLGSRTGLPVGVSKNTATASYEVRCPDLTGKRLFLGYFYEVYDAFAAYKLCKESNIRKLAEQFRDQISEKAYNWLLSAQITETGLIKHDDFPRSIVH